jgi:hypothetical protein
MKPFEVEVPCPGCGRKFKERMANMKPGNVKTCPSCRQSIRYTGDDASKVERELKRSVEKLERTFRDLHRKLR